MISVGTPLPAGWVVSATATDAGGNTSEFSDCREALSFYTVPPCRLLDTRSAGSSPISAGEDRVIPVAGACGIPVTARAIAGNLTAVGATGEGYLTTYPSGSLRPGTSSVNYRAGAARANNLVSLLGESGSVAVFCGGATARTDVLLDVSGYFE